MLGTFAKGTKENVFADVTDATSTITDLSGSGPTFDVEDSTNTFLVTGASATAAGMIITLLLDTTVGGTWPAGEYRLFVKFTVGPQVIRKGPFYFQIAD